MLHERITHTQHKRREERPRRAHSRTFYPRPARSRSSLRPTSQSRTAPITLLRLAVKLICPDCVSAPMKAIHDREPGIARPSVPSAPSACLPDRPTERGGVPKLLIIVPTRYVSRQTDQKEKKTPFGPRQHVYFRFPPPGPPRLAK